MVKYTNWDVVFQEVPDEVSVAIDISNCPIHCPGCHSKWLWNDIGDELTFERLDDIISSQLEGITCVALMGGDSDIDSIVQIAKYIREVHHLKVAWYSGRIGTPSDVLLSYLDYIKLGPYIEDMGGLDSPTTNQRFYKVIRDKDVPTLCDITYKFWKS